MSESGAWYRRIFASGAFQHSQEMTQSSAQRTTISLNRAGAAASRHVLIKKLGYQCFVDALQAQSATVYPLCKLANTAEILGKRGRCAVAVCQVKHVRIDVTGEWPFGEPMDAGVLG